MSSGTASLVAYLAFLLVFCVVMFGSAARGHYRYPWTILIAGAVGIVPCTLILWIA